VSAALRPWLLARLWRSVEAPITGARPPLIGMGVVATLAALLPVLSTEAFQLSRYELVLTYMLVTFGLNFSFGYAGQLSIAQPVVMGAGAYAAGLLSVKSGWNAWATLVPSLAAGVATGVLVGLPGLRLRGWYLGVAGFFAVLVFPDVLTATQTYTGGDDGLGPITPFPGVGQDQPVLQFEFILACVVLTWLAVRAVASSRHGIALRALRDSPEAAESVGINLRSAGMLAVAVGAAPVALAGWVFAHSTAIVAPNLFGFDLMLLVMGAVLLGGRGTLWGPVVGTAVFEGLSLYIGPFSPYNPIILGGGVLLTAVLFPLGVVPIVRNRIRDELLRRVGRRHRPSALAQVDETAELAIPPRAGAGGDDDAPILEARGIEKSFGGIRVLRGVDMSLRPRRIYGLVGPNGSGKTTLLNIVTGFVLPDQGEVVLEGRPIHGMAAHAVARRGVRRSFQVPQLVRELSAAENIRLGLHGRRGTRAEQDPLIRRVAAMVGLDVEALDVPVRELPLGMRRIIEIARAVVAGPALVCLDEPAAGLAASDLDLVRAALRAVAGSGAAVLLIEHNLPFVRSVADELVVLELGNVATTQQLPHAAEVAAS
jgi:branched-chain amino acid transport system permease protein